MVQNKRFYYRSFTFRNGHIDFQEYLSRTFTRNNLSKVCGRSENDKVAAIEFDGMESNSIEQFCFFNRKYLATDDVDIRYITNLLNS